MRHLRAIINFFARPAGDLRFDVGRGSSALCGGDWGGPAFRILCETQNAPIPPMATALFSPLSLPIPFVLPTISQRPPPFKCPFGTFPGFFSRTCRQGTQMATYYFKLKNQGTKWLKYSQIDLLFKRPIEDGELNREIGNK